MSWYIAPVRTSSGFAPMAIAASAARFPTCIECWKVPGASCDILCSSLLLRFDSSISVTLDMIPNVRSMIIINGYMSNVSMELAAKYANINVLMPDTPAVLIVL